ncbi:hypothetical protein [Aliarcobacter butzleri]|uniref:hypothetical protein n=1 Tax=Aliarcobacter butzleri TaxID=28197 RepID=UPI00125FD2B3|nr:hypothetical protein [Aliarcobacter butzleri]
MSEEEKKVLNLILQKMEDYEELLLLTISTLTTKKAVANFLKKTDRMIDYYIENGKFQEGVHYLIDEDGKKEFIPQGIVDYKRNKNHKKDRKKVESEKKIFHPSVQNIVQGLKIG